MTFTQTTMILFLFYAALFDHREPLLSFARSRCNSR
jgi:hypothetical protein